MAFFHPTRESGTQYTQTLVHMQRVLGLCGYVTLYTQLLVSCDNIIINVTQQ